MKHIEELLDEYMDDELSEAERDAVEKHLDICPKCQSLLLELTSLRQQICDVYQIVDISEHIEDKVLAEIQQKSGKLYAGMLNRAAMIMICVFGVIFFAAATPFFTLGLHLFQTLYSIERGLIYAIPSIITTIPYVLATASAIILLFIVLAFFIIRYLVHTIGKTAEAGDM